MADTTDESGATGAASGGAAKPFRIFTTEDEFNAHAAKIRHEAERKARGVTSDERAKLEAIEAELESRKVADLERERNYTEAMTLREKQASEKVSKAEASAQKARAAMQAHIVDKELRALALAHGAYDPEDIIARLAPRVALDDDYQVRVYDAPGGTVQTDTSMEQAVIELLKSKPHLAKAAGSGTSAGARGGASLGSSFSGTPSQREAQARVEAAKAKVQQNPNDHTAVAEFIRAQQSLKALAT